MNRRPNIIILNPDQMRADSMAHLGNPAAITPRLDALAQEGVSFTGGFCQNPVCTPSRCSFMSGLYPHVAGHRTMTHMMHPHEPVLLKELKDSGYHVWINQRNDLIPAQYPDYYKPYCSTYFRAADLCEALPDDNWRGEPGSPNFYSFFRGKVPAHRDMDQLSTEGAVEFIRNYKQEEPFCIFLPWMFPHPPYQAAEPFFSLIDRKKLPPRIRPPQDFAGKSKMLRELSHLQNLSGWDEAAFDELRAVYLGMVNRVDQMTGQIVDALKETGCYDNTAIFFFSDHGDYTGDYNLVEKVQNSFEDCLTNVPLIVKLPGSMQKRQGVCTELAELVDFYATACELAELPDTHTHFGRSLAPYIRLEEDHHRDAVFCEGGFRKGEHHCKETGGQGAPRPGGLYYPRQSLQCSDEMYNGKAAMLRTSRYKYVRRLYEQDEFYDLQTDPHELNNRIEDPRCRDLVLEMKERLLTFYQDSCDVVPFKQDLRVDAAIQQKLMRG